MGSGPFFVVLGAHVRVLTPINGCHFNANFAQTSIMIFILLKVNFFPSVRVKTTFVFTLTIQCNIWTLDSRLCIYVVRNMGLLT